MRRFDTKFAIAVAVAACFVLGVFLTSRDTGPSAEIDEEAEAQAALEAKEEAAAIVHAPPAFRPPVAWQDERPTDAEFRSTIERFCAETAAIRAEEDKRLSGVAVNRNWSPDEIEAADLKARAAELKRLAKGLDRAGLPPSQVPLYREWRADVRRLRAALLDRSAAIKAEKGGLAAALAGRIGELDRESRTLAAELELSGCSIA